MKLPFPREKTGGGEIIPESLWLQIQPLHIHTLQCTQKWDFSSEDETNFAVLDIGLCAEQDLAGAKNAPSCISFSVTLAWSNLKGAQTREEAKKITAGASKWSIADVSYPGLGMFLPAVLFQAQITQSQLWLFYYFKEANKEEKNKTNNDCIQSPVYRI